MKKRILPIMLLASVSMLANAQKQVALDTPGDSTDFLNLSLEDLMNVKVVSASRKEESIFNAPITSFVITAQDVFKSGATSIPEALKLCPGLIVKENTPGSYDVSIRGASQAPFQYQVVNTRNVLVMIDYRSVYNSYDGGTVWANLPIDLADIERIEIVEGPVASLYGPNAAAGIINIITKKVTQKNVARAITQHGLPGITNNSVFLGRQINNKLSVSVSGNYSQRERTANEYYDFGKKRYVSGDSLDLLSANTIFNLVDSKIQSNYQNSKISNEKYGINGTINYKVNDNTEVILRGGYSSGLGFKPVSNTTTNLMKEQLNTKYAQLFIQNSKLTAYVDYTGGEYEYLKNINSFGLNLNTVNVYIQYEFKLSDKLSLTPALSNLTSFNNTNGYGYTNKVSSFSLIQGNTISNYAPTIKLNYNPIEKLKLIGAFRLDKFSSSDKYLPNYTLVANYSINDNNLLRFNFSNAYAGDFGIRVDNSGINAGAYTSDSTVRVQTSNPVKNIKNQKYQTVELGLRSKVSKNINFDISGFYTQVNDIAIAYPISRSIDTVNVGTPNELIRTKLSTQFNVIPDMNIQQYGAILNVNISLLNNKILLKPYVLYQTNKYNNVPVLYSSPALSPVVNADNARVNFSNIMDPKLTGGASIDWNITSKLTLSTNTYFYSGYQVYGQLNRPGAVEVNATDPNNVSINYVPGGTYSGVPGKLPATPYTLTHDGSYVQAKIIFNAKLDYKIGKGLSAFINARNLTNNTKREWQFTDQIGGFYLLGLSYNY